MKYAFLSLLAVVPLLAADRQENDIKRIQAAASTLSEIMHAKDGGIPSDLMQKAHCVGIIPGLKRAGFVLAAEYGKGVLTCRVHDTNRWSAPAMIVLAGGSVGLQIGAGETDVVFIVTNQSGEEKLMKDKVAIGADVMAAAGPVGRDVSAQTDAAMRAEMLSWSRSRGVFAGVSLQGANLHADGDDNRALYGRDVTQQEILHGHLTAPEGAHALYVELERYAPKNPRTGE